MFGKKHHGNKVNTKVTDCQNIGNVKNAKVGIIFNLQESQTNKHSKRQETSHSK